MTLPESQAPLRDQGAVVGAGLSSGAERPLTTLRKRSEFLACAKARRAHVPGFTLQGRARRADEAEGIRVGFTCSKKVGKAVVRNRAKRRLRAVARAVLPRLGQAGWDYVLVGRPEVTVSRPFADLVGDLEAALGKLHADRRQSVSP